MYDLSCQNFCKACWY